MMSDRGSDMQFLDTLGPNPQWVAFTEDESLRGILSQVATKTGVPSACVQSGGIAAVRSFLNNGIEPQLIIIDLTRSPDLISEAKTLLSYCPQNTRVMAIGKDDHFSIFRELTHIGVIDYLILPIEENDMRNAINDALLAPATHGMKDLAMKLKPFTVILGTRGGIGSSTLSVNLSWATAFVFQKKVCLIDLDVYHSSVCILLDLVRNAGLNGVLTEVERLDEVFLKRILLQKGENLSILTGQLNLEQEITFSVDTIKILTALLREKFDYIYADMPPLLHTPFSQTILNTADHAILITDFSLLSIQNILSMKTFLATYMPHLKYKIVVNDIFPHKGEISKAMFEKSINSTVDAVLPYCKASMLEKMNVGEPFVKGYPNHEYTKRLIAFISVMYPQLKPIGQTKKFSLFKKWRGS